MKSDTIEETSLPYIEATGHTVLQLVCIKLSCIHSANDLPLA